MASWKWMFLITAALTVFWSIYLILALPTSQATAKFLTDEEKVAAVEMVRDNNTGIHNKTFKSAQMKEAFLDPKTYIFFWFAFFGNLANSVSTVSHLANYPRSIINSACLVRQSDHFQLRILFPEHNTGKLTLVESVC